MQCPNCRLEQPETSETCPACGLIFAKWRERHPEWNPKAAAPAPKAAPPEPDPLSEKLTIENIAPELAAPPADSTSSGQAGSPEPGSTRPDASIPPQNRYSKPLPEREYQEFPVKKFAIITGILVVLGGIAAVLIPSMKGGYATPQVIDRPKSIYGSAYEGTVEPTWTPVPCGYPFDTCTPTPIATPQTIAGPNWNYHGRVLDELHLNPIQGVQIVFLNNGVAVTATTNAQGLFEISVPPLAEKETYEVQLSHPNFGDRYWAEDPEGFSQQDRLARAYDYEENQHLRGKDGGGGDSENLVFSMFPNQLTEEEQMWLRNAHHSNEPPPSQ